MADTTPDKGPDNQFDRTPDSTADTARRRSPGHLARTWRRATTLIRRRVIRSDWFLCLLLSITAVFLGWAFTQQPRWGPSTLLALVVLAGGFLLRLRSLVVLYGVVGAVLAFELIVPDKTRAGPGGALVVVATGVIVLVLARSRARLGVSGTFGESMLVDLRDRLRAHGELPELPEGWEAEVVLRSAHGASFSGDFLVATKSTDGGTLEVAIVDVSGKGLEAGTRALLLAGAFGGLLGAMAPTEFLPAANQYLLRQRWDEGFATAAHLVLDLETGEFCITNAGHPPAAQFLAGSGRWRVTTTEEGPLLGVLPDAKYVGEAGRLDRGDALLLYTDGLIETPGRDLSVGIDRLVGEAERLVTRGFRHGARKLIDAVGSGEGDDRALLLIWRT
jgi:hypothetical protein